MSAGRSRRLVVGAALGLVLLAVFLRGVDPHALAQAFRAADPLLLAGVAFATVLTYLARSWRWGHLLSPVVHVPFGHLFSATAVGFMTGLVIPRAGEVVRPYLLARRHPISTATGFASIILERLLDLITVIFLFGLYLYVLPAPAAQVTGPLLDTLKAGGALAALLALTVLALLLALHLRAGQALALAERVFRPFPARLTRPLVEALRAFASGLAVLEASPAHLMVIAGQSMLVWLPIALGLYWNNLAFGLDLPFHATFLLLAALTVGVAVPTPGMVGGFHAAYLLALTEAFGVDRQTAAAAGIASHALTNVPVLFLGLVFLGREGLSMGKVAQMSEQQGAHRREAVPDPVEAR
ncbi:MAG TPA: lysylphosphatidylglycerol synthase transmembrane domain-containing protein [Vicinamibacteria bacterium]|nr:lysylphosphatidylglycerol synthase transmembrane domain-containing protein [Vicinamibacteria bacterium]